MDKGTNDGQGDNLPRLPFEDGQEGKGVVRARHQRHVSWNAARIKRLPQPTHDEDVQPMTWCEHGWRRGGGVADDGREEGEGIYSRLLDLLYDA